MKRILITGANGQLGSEIRSASTRYSSYIFIFTDYLELDITDHQGVNNFIKEQNISIIINCAAYTAVDKAEKEIKMSNQLNADAAENLARVCKNCNVSLVHISTDYVFSGEQFIPYTEDDETWPNSVYGSSKLAGENLLQKINPARSIIIRTSWIYSRFGNNFVKTMLRLGKEKETLGVVCDQIGSPTYARDLAFAILEIVLKINNIDVEVFHYANEGVCSWYDFSKAIFEYEEIMCKVNPLETKEYPTSAIRPYYSVLNKKKFKETYNMSIPYWKDSLVKCLMETRSIDQTT